VGSLRAQRTPSAENNPATRCVFHPFYFFVLAADALQLFPGLSVFSHSDFISNTDGEALSIAMLTARAVSPLPAFLIVTVLGLLVVPALTLSPNDSECGLIVSFSAIGVGVAVAVGVAGIVGVAVAVGVTVALLVA
jgi:hypothetical protein